MPKGDALRLAGEGLRSARAARTRKRDLEAYLRAVLAAPEAYTEDPHFAGLAAELIRVAEARAAFAPREQPACYRTWGDEIDDGSHEQMRNACRLPITMRGALMPDAHIGYGLPIGGVLATRAAVIPYAVGVDIACRMKMTVLDLPVDAPTREPDRLRKVIERETRFGIGASFRKRREHGVMDADWSVSPVTRRFKDKAWSQLGTSGSGNHFVEFGTLTVTDAAAGLPAGSYLALLSHSGSRGTGASVCDFYSKLAQDRHPGLPPELRHLAWLDLASEAGQEYWAAMQLMGQYAAANHACIHRHVAKGLGAKVMLDIENHHNFAWEEEHDGETVIVHRKGATPAGEGVIGIIPGSMASPGYVVRGRGNADALASAAHGAGRRMSRTKAKQTYRWAHARAQLDECGVELISAGIDEAPMVYKDIDRVMAAQADLVETLARFDPKLVKMAPAGERPED